LYIKDEDFKKVVEDPSLHESFTLQEGFLFNENKLCIPKSTIRDLIVKEAHGGALAGHFGITKILEILWSLVGINSYLAPLGTLKPMGKQK